MAGVFIAAFVTIFVGAALIIVVFTQYKRTLREAKNYEYGDQGFQK
jgi:hypothetical protein